MPASTPDVDIDLCGDGRRQRIRDLYERLMVTAEGASAVSLRRRLRAEIDRPRACGTSHRDVALCARCGRSVRVK